MRKAGGMLYSRRINTCFELLIEVNPIRIKDEHVAVVIM